MEAAGLRDLTRETVSFDKEVADWAPFAHGIVFGNPFFDEIQSRGGVAPDEVEQAILSALREHFGAEPATMPLLATVYSGSAS